MLINVKKKKVELSEQSILRNKEKLQKIKNKVQKYYPNAKTMIDSFCNDLKSKSKIKYFIVDGNGYRIIPDDFKIADQETVLKAWKLTWMYIVRNNIIQKNSEKFNGSKCSDNNLISKMYTQD